MPERVTYTQRLAHDAARQCDQSSLNGDRSYRSTHTLAHLLYIYLYIFIYCVYERGKRLLNRAISLSTLMDDSGHSARHMLSKYHLQQQQKKKLRRFAFFFLRARFTFLTLPS